MNEDFLHYCWKFKYFTNYPLKTTTGESIEILATGFHNHNAGPDFSQAKIKIGKTIWAGNVEIHTTSSQWYAHKHQSDKAYQNVILHVVFEHDKEVKLPSGQNIPVLQLKDHLNSEVELQYKKFLQSKTWVPCANHLEDVPDIIKHQCLENMMIERLEEKTAIILEELKQQNNDWAETFYIRLAHNFGFKVNSDAFELLTKRTHLKALSKQINDLTQIEAILFGQAGMLNKTFEDNYPNHLKKEYKFLQKKYQFNPIEEHLWRFARMRPVNFPTLRIAQFAQLIYQSSHLFSKILEIDNTKEMKSLFSDIIASGYWSTHYVFDKASKKSLKKLGQSSIENILINTISPFVFAYGKYHQIEQHKEFSLQLLEKIKPEKNHIISGWEENNFKAKNAFESQALIHLKNNYCNQKKCLNCSIGHHLIKPN